MIRLRLFILLIGVWKILTSDAGANHGSSFEVLIFSKTTGFRHASITNAVVAVRELASQNHFSVTNTEDSTWFTDTNLARFRAVIFLMTTGDVLDESQEAAFERFIQAGNGYVGVHSASDTEYEWPWYGGLVGTYFNGHPYIQSATIRVEDLSHQSTSFLPTNWIRTDEWYNFSPNPRSNVHVLARLDESTYSGGSMGDHPIVWCHEYDGGRAWYTGGGHTEASYSEPLFRRHLLEGILYAAGWQPTLDIVRGGNGILLSWPIGPDFLPQARASIQSNISWTVITNPVAGVSNGQNRLVLPASAAMEYFRLTR
jgi:cytochrome c